MKTKRILIVDDKHENRYLLRTLLQGHGYEVEEASHGKEALELARQKAPDLIISDILMPVLDGFALCREWKRDARLKTVPFIFYTATYTDDRDREFALSLGAQRFIIKPEEPDAFLGIIIDVLRQVTAKQASGAQPAADSLARPPDELQNGKEHVYLKQYNEALIRKLEGKMEELELSNRRLEHDIAERKRTEEALHESEHHFRTLADSGMALIWTAGTDKKCNYFNKRWMEFTGRTLGQELGDGWTEGIHPDDFARCVQTYSDAFDRQETFSMNYRLRRHDGEYRWLQDVGTPRYDTKGTFLGYIGHCLDITELKNNEKSSQQQLDELRRWHTAMLGRESRILELKGEVNELLTKAGLPIKYESAGSPEAAQASETLRSRGNPV